MVIIITGEYASFEFELLFEVFGCLLVLKMETNFNIQFSKIHFILSHGY